MTLMDAPIPVVKQARKITPTRVLLGAGALVIAGFIARDVWNEKDFKGRAVASFHNAVVNLQHPTMLNADGTPGFPSDDPKACFKLSDQYKIVVEYKMTTYNAYRKMFRKRLPKWDTEVLGEMPVFVAADCKNPGAASLKAIDEFGKDNRAQISAKVAVIDPKYHGNFSYIQFRPARANAVQAPL